MHKHPEPRHNQTRKNVSMCNLCGTTHGIGRVACKEGESARDAATLEGTI